ncbi:MAG TPA: hypothetical protein VNO30_10040 [Kofleriaceae bacterium]|nr:hypothetical protein [Kofleriaceae bacterium]
MMHEEPAELGAVEAELKAPKPSKPPLPPPDASPSPQDAPMDSGAPGFVDACLLPGMTLATFTATGTIDGHDEGVTAALPLPFPFTFYGTSHSTFWLTTNGQLGFGDTVGGSAFGQAKCPLPDSRFATPILLAYSADLVVRYDPGLGVCYATTGTSPDRKLVVTWKDLFFYESWLTSHVTFSAELHEGTNAIDVLIDRVDAPSLPSYEAGYAAVVGKQAGSAGSASSCFQPLAPEGTVVHF